jgi:hypothetical protein
VNTLLFLIEAWLSFAITKESVPRVNRSAYFRDYLRLYDVSTLDDETKAFVHECLAHSSDDEFYTYFLSRTNEVTR